MDVRVTLTDTHELILSALSFVKPERFDDLAAAARLLGQTDYRYLDLLKIAVGGAIDRDSLFWLVKHNHPGTLSRGEIEKEFHFLERIGLVSKETGQAATEPASKGNASAKQLRPRLTEEGERIATAIIEGRKPILRPVRAEQTTIFVASDLNHDDVDNLFQGEIEPLCKEFGYIPVRVDRLEPSQSITNAILEGIQKAACVIADLTYARPSVYFEVGLAHGLGVPLVLTCRQDHHNGSDPVTKVHFDLEQYKISYWTAGDQGVFLWGGKHAHPRKRLQAVLGQQ